MPSSTKASSDFGLYKEINKPKITIKLVLVLLCTLFTAFTVFFVIIHLINTDPYLETSSSENTLETPSSIPPPEKLLVAESVKRETQNAPPKPFGVTYRGQPPAQFTSTTEKGTTLNYPPQLGQYHHQRYFPKNIQDVIGASAGYAKPSLAPIQLVPDSKYYRNYKESSSRKNEQQNNFSFHDPFYLYKPQDPSDINLLATGSFRFAPPIWSNLKTPFSPRFHQSHQYIPIQQHQVQHEENTNRQEIYQHQKPITLTLNIYPNNNNNNKNDNNNELKVEQIKYNSGLKQIIRNKLENIQAKIRFPGGGDNRPKKMVIHLNLYPDSFATGESKVKAKKIPPSSSTIPTAT